MHAYIHTYDPDHLVVGGRGLLVHVARVAEGPVAAGEVVVVDGVDDGSLRVHDDGLDVEVHAHAGVAVPGQADAEAPVPDRDGDEAFAFSRHGAQGAVPGRDGTLQSLGWIAAPLGQETLTGRGEGLRKPLSWSPRGCESLKLT